MSTNDVSRRSFLKGAAVAGSAVAVAGMATTAVAAPAWLPEAWDYETDVLVIGYGGAGMWAAVTAADEGNAEVLILEKAPVRGGGNSSINLGEFTVPIDADGCAEYILSFGKGNISETMAHAWANEAVRNGEYATRWGIPWVQNAGTAASRYTSSCEYPFLPGSDSMAIGAIDGLGMNFWAVMDANREELGIPVLYSVTNEELIQNPETKEILGCYADYQGKRIAIKARKGTIMTIGGFEFNDELKNEYLRVYPCDGFYGWPFNTGDGIKMVQKVGAQLWHMNCIIGGCNPNFHDPEYPFAIQCSPKGNSYLHVDRAGRRWHNEKTSSSPHVGWHQYTKFDDSICDYVYAPFWAIIDQACFEAGRIGPDGSNPNIRGMLAHVLPDECGRYYGWSDDNQAEVERGWILKGETLEELAQKIAAQDKGYMSAENLTAAVARFNELCAAGEDTDFGRGIDTMAALGAGPYYAWAIYPGGCSTLGGPKKNEFAQVLDVCDNPIPRLYAAGCFGNFAAHTYGISGGNNAENMVWGRIAARDASALAAWDA